MEQTPHRRPWRGRLSVRALMILVLAIGGALGWFVHRARVQRDAVAAIERAGGKAYYDWQVKTIPIPPDWGDLVPDPKGRPNWPGWLTDRVGPDYYGTVKMVLIRGEADPVMPQVGRLDRLEELDFLPRGKTPVLGPTDVGMVHLRNLARLKHLKLGILTRGGAVGSKITGPSLAAIAGATRLQILQLQGIPLADADLDALRGMTDLRDLTLDGPAVTDAGLARLAGLVELRRLSLPSTRVTAAGLAHLRGMTRLENLNLSLTRVDTLEPCRTLPALKSLDLPSTPIVDAGLAPASVSAPGFPALANLNLSNTRVGDEGLRQLRDLPKLGRVDLTGTDVADAAVAEFRAARPKTRVVRMPPPAKAPPVPVAR